MSKKDFLLPIFLINNVTGITAEAVPMIMHATGSVDNFSFGAILVPINPPTKTIRLVTDMVKDWAITSSHTFFGKLLMVWNRYDPMA